MYQISPMNWILLFFFVFLLILYLYLFIIMIENKSFYLNFMLKIYVK